MPVPRRPVYLLLPVAIALSLGSTAGPSGASGPLPSNGMQPEGCWALTIYDYLAPIGKTPDEAVDALAAKVAAEEPTDRNDQARQAAIVSLAEQLVVASTSPGRIAYEARDKAGLVGTFEVQSWSTEGWVVARTVVPMPASFCQSEDSSAND